MRRFFIVLLLLLSPSVFMGCGHKPAAAAGTPARAPLLINVTRGSDDLHAVSMALELARTARGRGHEVVVFLNVAAPVLATAGLGQDVRHADFPPVTQMVQELISGGGKVIVCGHCAKVQNIADSDFLPGVVISHHGELLDHLETGMVGLSY